MTHDERFRRLTARLSEWRPLWGCPPFQHPTPPWRSRCPGLAETLLALPEAEVARLQAAPFSASPLDAWLPVAELARLVELPSLAGAAEALPEAWGEQVGGRKWRQLQAFLPQVEVAPGEGLVEWCAGKGHLARALARLHDTEVTALEWDPALCADGEALAERQGARVTLRVQDVMAADAARWLDGQTRVAALHACGDLHRRLLELVAATGSALTLAPCCYQRTADDRYRPLSRLGAELAEAHGLALSRDDLALAVQETVTAPRGVQRHRERAGAWRLGFDRLQREVRGVDAYLPVPSLAYGRMPATFEGFCRWAAEQKGIDLPTGLDWAGLEAAGRRRQREVARLELVRHLFRRPLEVWLALDRLCFLEEAGHAVELGTFCARALTPRNLVLRARRR
ncbi:methyltransferase [Halomonas sp. BM-2019]|uniref:methyltransferase n=1 Tax=Halomonas sp. BM-2019 TaxID=2811227 RepID=UPI001B3C2BBE|nr:MAG: methyltransferase [Halomonas sp. BM-2019]